MPLEKKIRFKRLRAKVLTAAFILLGTYALFLWKVLPENRLVLTIDSEIEVERVGLPVNIRIPSITLVAPILGLSLTADGHMEAPAGPFETGWYELGPRPGEPGNAVIDGHVNWWYGSSAVFTNLHKVKVGDSVMVEDEWGETTFFVVREIKTYKAEADATDVFNSNDSKVHLNLITCSGVWDKNTGEYAERLVIFTDGL